MRLQNKEKGSLLIVAVFLITAVAAMGIAVTSIYSNSSMGGIKVMQYAQDYSGKNIYRATRSEQPDWGIGQDTEHDIIGISPPDNGDPSAGPNSSLEALTGNIFIGSNADKWDWGGGTHHSSVDAQTGEITFGAAGGSSSHTGANFSLCNVDGAMIYLQTDYLSEGPGKKALTIQITAAGQSYSVPSVPLENLYDDDSGTIYQALGVFNPATDVSGINVIITCNPCTAGVKNNQVILSNFSLGPGGGCPASQQSTVPITIESNEDGGYSLIIGAIEQEQQTYTDLAGCAWVNRVFMLGGGDSPFRSFFRFQAYPGVVESSPATRGGFTFAIVPAETELESGGAAICGGPGADGSQLGYVGLSAAGSVLNKFGFEFDLHSDSAKSDAAGNHVALIQGNSVYHSTSCGDDPGCVTGSAASWLEEYDAGAQKPKSYAARIEVAQEPGCSVNGTSGNARARLWLCEPGAACQSSVEFSTIRYPFITAPAGLTVLEKCFNLPSGADFSRVKAGFTMASGAVPFGLAVSDLRMFPYAAPLHWPFDQEGKRGPGVPVPEANTGYVFDTTQTPSGSGASLVLGASPVTTLGEAHHGDVAVDDFTFSVWAHLSDFPVADEPIIAKGGANSGDPGYRLTLDPNGYARFQLVAGDGTLRSVASERPVAKNKWTHLAVVVERQNPEVAAAYQVRLYVDNIRQAGAQSGDFNVIFTDKVLSSTLPLSVGGNLTGWLDDVRFYNYALPNSQIKHLYDIKGDSTQ